jgi:hypothetical protein
VFSGYERLALRTIYNTFGLKHKIIFVHKGNWHELLPNLAGTSPVGNHFRSDSLDDDMRMDYVKSQILCHYGGYWVPVDTIVTTPDVHEWMTNVVLPLQREKASLASDVPLVAIGGHKEQGYSVVDNTGAAVAKWTVDSAVIYAEPQNPVMRAIANQMQIFVTKSYNHSDYSYGQWFTKAFQAYTNVKRQGALAQTVMILPDAITGSVDDTGSPVTVDHYFRQRPLENLPNEAMRWMVVNTHERRVSSYRKHEWFTYITEEAIVQSPMWISMVYRRGLGLDGKANNVRSTAGFTTDAHPLLETWISGWPRVVDLDMCQTKNF